ncbi:MAG: transporter substrate-binding domain-containing protein [Pararhodobacter sp.]|nr:transporter substrate-binding domain-containing protein [Pararhodobacter sp.]
MKRLTLAAAALALSASAAFAQDVVRLGTEGLYPPFNFINDSTGELTGFEIELGDILCERAGLTCEWVTNDWDTIIPNLVAGNYDAIMAGMSITDARREVISFTEAYKRASPSAYMALAGTDESVIGSGVIAAQSNTVQAGLVADTDATLLEFPTPDDTISAVRNGEVDAVLADREFLAPFVADSGGELVFIGEAVTPGDGIGMGIRQSDDELRATFNDAIESVKADGTLNELLTRWFGDEEPLFD